MSIYSAVSGAVAQTQVLDNVANNLANVSTAGFKGSRMRFDEVLARAAARGGPAARAAGSFVCPGETRLDLRNGAVRPTERKLDVALEGPGYLCVQDGAKEAYTRGGSLQLRPDGVLADADGRPLIGRDDKPLRPGIDATALIIDGDGRVRVGDAVIGQLKLVEAAQPTAIQHQGANLLVAPAAAGLRPAQLTRVQQGHIEASNVNAVSEMTSMIVASRTYETLHSVISTYRSIDSRAANDLGQER